MKADCLLAVFTIIPSLASAETLIQCPDWKSLVAQGAGAAIRKVAASDDDFQNALQRNNAMLLKVSQSQAPLDAIGLTSGAQPASAAAKGVASTKAAAAPVACSYTVRQGDTLHKIARSQLGAAARWSEIPPLNVGVIKDNNILREDAQVQLPCGGGGVGQGVGRLALPVTPALQPAASLPVWTAKPGEYFSDALKRWAKQAGYKVVIDTREDWQFSVAVSEQGTFKDVLQRVVRGLAAQGTAPAVQVYANNVITVGG